MVEINEGTSQMLAKNSDYAHLIIHGLSGYVQGRVHTNSIENFWSLLKRTLKGTCVSVDPYDLFRYLDEQGFRSTAVI